MIHTVTLPITNRYRGPLILKEGLRPFFLLANAWAIVSMLMWIGILHGLLDDPQSFSAIDWHRHELLFAYPSAIIAGFLLTAVGNWTGRAPVAGNRLLVLGFIWLAGRLVMYVSWSVPSTLIAIIDLAFPLALISVLARELLLGKSYRNLKVLVVVALFTGADAAFHIDVMRGSSPVMSSRLGLTAVLLLIMVIGGRIIPAFTRSWLLKTRAAQVGKVGGEAKAARLPAPFGYYDRVTVLVSALMLFTWTFIGESGILGWGMLLAAVLQLVRLARWCGEKTFSDPLVLILHQAYAFIPLGFFAFAASQLWTLTITTSAATHLWTAGAVSVTSMAVMTRASLGHTGQALVAGQSIVFVYALLMGSVLVRFVAGSSEHYLQLIQLSALLWCSAHGLFLLRFFRHFFTAK